MKTFLSYTRQAALPLLVIVMVVIMTYLATGCAGSQVNVKPVQDPAVINAVLEEAGSSLTYFGLQKQSDETLGRISAVLSGAKGSLLRQDINLMALVPQITDQLRKEAEWNEDYEYLLGRVCNLLSQLVRVDISLPENSQAVIAGIGAFLRGAEEGIEALKKAR